MSTAAEEKHVTDLGLPGDAYDWPEVFKYANEPFLVVQEPKKDRWRTDNLGTKAEPFDLGSVERIEAATVGENDGPDWLAFGTLHDGRWFSIAAGCDYTGWG